jgi:tetratricopeptide (TPR) repeat protein
MDSYREALEILRAANAEEEEEEEEGQVQDEAEEGEGEGLDREQEEEEGGGTQRTATTTTVVVRPPSQIAIDLADTLTNVGNFHLRRDELDAAHGAYSSAWALYDTERRRLGGIVVVDVVDYAAGGASSSTLSGSVVGSALAAAASADNPSATNSYPEGALAASNRVYEFTINLELRMAQTLNNLGVVHERRSDLREALSCYESVYRIRLHHQLRDQRRTRVDNDEKGNDDYYDDDDDDCVSVDAINVLLNIGNVHHRLGECDEACATFGKVVCLCKRAIQTMTLTDDDGGGENDSFTRILQSLAGALRNWGTCYLEQHIFSDAIDKLNEAAKAEENVIDTLMSSSSPTSLGEGEFTTTAKIGGNYNRVAALKRARESKAQLLGLLGCIYLECKLDGQSAESFREAIIIYRGLGYDDSDSKIIWASHNLAIAEKNLVEARDPPALPLRDPPAPIIRTPAAPHTTPLSLSMPPATTPPSTNKHATTRATTDDKMDDEGEISVGFENDIDSTVELDELLAEDGKYAYRIGGGGCGDDDESIFVGVDTCSADELDEFMTRAGVSRSGGGAVLQSKERGMGSKPKSEPGDCDETRESFQGKRTGIISIYDLHCNNFLYLPFSHSHHRGS